MAKRKELTDEVILKSREAVSRFGNISPLQMSRITQLNLVGLFYSKIHGVDLRNVPEAQLFRIAERIYQKMPNDAKEPTSFEKPFLGDIQRLQKMIRDGEDYSNFDESLCIRLVENFPEDHYLNSVYSRAKSRRASA
jgi:hypothetical protein